MDYADAVAAFFAPRPAGTQTPSAVSAASPARRLRDACEPIATHAIWSPLTNHRLADRGLDFLGAYVGGRGANLGRPTGPVVAAAFAWFEPGLVSALYDGALATLDRDELFGIRALATTESLRSTLAEIDEAAIAHVAAALTTATATAPSAGHPLFSGVLASGQPADPYQRLWWACELVREHRGDSHVAAACAAGLGPVEMNVLTELWIGMPLFSYTGTRAWSPDAMAAAVDTLVARGWLADGVLTPAGVAARNDIELRTDAQEVSVVDALGDQLEEICALLQAWGDACILAGAFPQDIFKRAAG